MSDREWFCVEEPGGQRFVSDGKTEFLNEESAVDAARRIAPLVAEDTLVVVKYSRQEIRTLKKKVTIDEADVSSPA